MVQLLDLKKKDMKIYLELLEIHENGVKSNQYRTDAEGVRKKYYFSNDNVKLSNEYRLNLYIGKLFTTKFYLLLRTKYRRFRRVCS